MIKGGFCVDVIIVLLFIFLILYGIIEEYSDEIIPFISVVGCLVGFIVVYHIIKKLVITICCDRYFHSEEFYRLKQEHQKYTDDFNDLNVYIDSLKEINLTFQKTYYGLSQYSDNSIYNFTRNHLKNVLQSSNIYDCSLSVLKNARNKPFVYICKYFNIEKNEENLKIFEDLLNKYISVDEGKKILSDKKEALLSKIENQIPDIVKTHQKERIFTELGFSKINASQLYFPSFTFRYISAGGNSNQTERIVLNTQQLELFVYFLSEKIKLKASVKGQRALMTKSLRQSIQKRDNYTCCECGNSIYKEPNLLLEIDHIIPLSKGGMTAEDNLQTLCWKCNRRKGSKIY